MQLSLKPKTFSDLFNPFLESTSNFKLFEKKKMIVKATLFRKLETVRNLVRLLSKKHPLRALFDSQYVKTSETLSKSS